MRLRDRVWPALPPEPQEMPGAEPLFRHRARALWHADRAEALAYRARTVLICWSVLFVHELLVNLGAPWL